MTVRQSPAWRRVRWGLALLVLCTLATCPAAVKRCSVAHTASEAPTLLRYQIDQVRAYVVDHGTLPPGNVGPTPAIGACCTTGHTCVPEASQWHDPTWQALRFSIDGRHRFSYQVAHDGAALVLRAVGDQDCDGVFATVQVTLTLDGGQLVETWTRDHPLE
jgi:hypothetical protein